MWICPASWPRRSRTYTERQLEAAANGWASVPEWLFCSETGGLLDPERIRRGFYKLLRHSGLRRVRFHDLRHTFASLLLQQGESLVYVRDQMGHASITMTVDVYGYLIPGSNKQAVDRLDSNPSEGENAPLTPPRGSGEWGEVAEVVDR